MKQRDDLRLALTADICLNSARKALREGPQKIRGRAGERAAEAMERLGLNPESHPSKPPPQAA